jgi:hypothetical protein
MVQFNFFILIKDAREIDRAITVIRDQSPGIEIDRQKINIISSSNIVQKLAGIRLPLRELSFIFEDDETLFEVKRRFGDSEFSTLFLPGKSQLSILRPNSVKYNKLIEI